MLSKMNLVPWRSRLGLRQGECEWEHPLDAVHRELVRTFEDLWRGFEMPMVGRYGLRDVGVMPRMDVTEDEDRIRVTLELPGMNEDDVEIGLVDNVLTIKGEKKVETEETERPYAYRERTYGSFRRSIPLDVEVMTDKVEATFENGVVLIDLPKTAEAKKPYKKIPIRAAGKLKKMPKAA